jgi:tetratricopeptide (TPR) repeat protein
MVAMRPQTSKLSFGIGIYISILLLTGALFAAGTNTLNVKCVDAAGKALAGAKVDIVILGGGGKVTQTKKADGGGIAKFEKLDDGVYRVIARPEAMAPGLFELVSLKNGAQESVTVTCNAGDPLKKFYFEDPALNQQAMEALKAAEPMLNSNKWAEAEQQIRSSLELNPSSPDALYFLGLTLIQQTKWDAAKVAWEKDLGILNALVNLPPQKDAKGVAQPSPYLNMQKAVTALIAQLPALKLKVEGTEELNKGNFKAAIAKFQEALKITQMDPDAYYNMSLALARDNQYDAAGQALNKAIELRPDDKGYLDFKQKLAKFAQTGKAKDLADQGDAMFKTNDYLGAMKKYEEALAFVDDAPTQAALWMVIGRARTQASQYEAAVTAYKRAIELAPNDTKAADALKNHYVVVGQQLINKKEYDQAFAAYKQGGVSVFKLGKDWANKKETEDLAVLAFQQVIKDKSDPQNAEAYFELGSLYYFRKDYARAKENLNTYLQIGKDEKVLENTKNILGTIAAMEKKK